MFLERLMNQTSAPLLERVLDFTAARQKLIAENIANVDTPGYLQKDLDVERFNTMLQDRVERADDDGGAASFGGVDAELRHPTDNILFHDGNNRSMEQLNSDMAKNGLLHNMVVELL